MKVLIVDDEKLARVRLRKLLEKLQIEGIFEADDAFDAQKILHDELINVVLLDIDMPEVNGLELAKEINKLSNRPAIIFCTSYDEYALNAFAVNADAYLLKPIHLKDLQESLSKAQDVNVLQIENIKNKMTQDQEKYFVIKTYRGIERIPHSALYYFMANQKYVTLYHKHGEQVTDLTLKKLEDILGDDVLRIHRNTLILKKHLTKVTKNSQGLFFAYIAGVEKPLIVSRRHFKDVKNYLKITDAGIIDE